MILLCNEIPQFDNQNDNAMWQRCRYINFPITFVDDPKKENEKKIDYELKNKLYYWKEDFMLLLIDYYKLYKKEGLLPEQSVLNFTNEIKDEQNIFKQYMNERTQKSEKKHIHTGMLYEDFIKWFIKNNPNEKNMPSNKEFSKELRKINYLIEKIKINNIVANGIKNIKLT